MAAHEANLQLRVFYLWKAGVKAALDPQFNHTFAWDVDLLSGYDHEFVANIARRPGSDHFGGLINPSLPARLAEWRPDAVLLFGYNYATHLGLILWARLCGLPLVFRGDSHLLGNKPVSKKKRLLLSLIYRQFTAFACVGTANRDYFRTFGVPDQKLFFVPHCVDADRFSSTIANRTDAARLRTSLGLDGFRVILFAGKLVPAKQPLALLKAFLDLAPVNTALVFVGDGSERASLQTLADAHPGQCVRILPFANQSEMPSRYLLADLFVLPSRGHYETWGLAVNEAMHLGVPCLVSNVVGCQRDLVTDGDTGWVFDPSKPDALRITLQRALHDLDTQADAFRVRVTDRIAGYTYEAASAGLSRAVASLFQTP
jgi:glycosyltransferase involved in cell wall biosynthesis